MKKLIFIFIFILIILFIFQINIFAYEVNITQKCIDNENNRTIGYIPKIDNFNKKYVKNDINENINNIVNSKINFYEDESLNLIFNYDYKEYDNISSIILYTSVSNKYGDVINQIDTINFDNKTGANLTLKNILTDDYATNFDKENIYLRKNYEYKNFYVENGDIILLFDSYELNKNNKNITNVYTCVYNEEGIKMFPLRLGLDVLGYEVIWDDNTEKAIIMKDDLNIYIKPYEQNSYEFKLIDEVFYATVDFFYDIVEYDILNY